MDQDGKGRTILAIEANHRQPGIGWPFGTFGMTIPVQAEIA